MPGSPTAPLITLSANSCWNIVNFRKGLLKAFDHAGLRVSVLAPEGPGADELMRRGAAHTTVPIDSQGLSPVADARLFSGYRRELARLRPSALLAFTAKPNIYGSLAAASLGIPVINNISGLGTAFIRGGWLERMVTSMYCASLRRSSTVFFQNADDLALFLDRRMVTLGQARLINGSGVDLAAFAPPADSSHDGNAVPFFLLIARMLRDKGVAEFVEAARIVRSKRPGARFQLLGPLGAANRSAITAAEMADWVDAGTVEYLGETDDVRPFIAASDCVVLPSYREGLPRSLIEAAASGRPAIATDVPGCRAAVDHGWTGFLCDARSSVSLAAAMLRFDALAPAERQRMGEQAREKAVREFDEARVGDAYFEALRRAGVSVPRNGASS